MFQLDLAPADPILGLTETFKADTHPDKINLGVGVYQDATGQTPILEPVKQAERRLLETETSKSYLSIPGVPEVASHTQELLFGEGHAIIREGRAKTAQTPGGTGALRVAADFLQRARPPMQLISQRKTQSCSATYKQRAERLVAAGRMQPTGRDAIIQSKRLGLWDVMQDVDALVVPDDLQILLDKNPTAATYFETCPPSYKRNVLRWLKSAKTERTRQKRLHSIFTECKAENRIPQM